MTLGYHNNGLGMKTNMVGNNPNPILTKTCGYPQVRRVIEREDFHLTAVRKSKFNPIEWVVWSSENLGRGVELPDRCFSTNIHHAKFLCKVCKK